MFFCVLWHNFSTVFRVTRKHRILEQVSNESSLFTLGGFPFPASELTKTVVFSFHPRGLHFSSRYVDFGTPAGSIRFVNGAPKQPSGVKSRRSGARYPPPKPHLCTHCCFRGCLERPGTSFFMVLVVFWWRPPATQGLFRCFLLDFWIRSTSLRVRRGQRTRVLMQLAGYRRGAVVIYVLTAPCL